MFSWMTVLMCSSVINTHTFLLPSRYHKVAFYDLRQISDFTLPAAQHLIKVQYYHELTV